MSWLKLQSVQLRGKFYAFVVRQANLCPDLKYHGVKQFFVQFGKQIYDLVEGQANLRSIWNSTTSSNFLSSFESKFMTLLKGQAILCPDLKFHGVKQTFVQFGN